jgi:hypothetical protein
MAETQPKLQPALLSFSATSSQYFTAKFCRFCHPHSNEKMIRTAAITELIHENQSDHSNDNARTRVRVFRARKSVWLGNFLKNARPGFTANRLKDLAQMCGAITPSLAADGAAFIYKLFHKQGILGQH